MQSPNQLLVEGGRSYHQALAALSEFQQLVLDTCRKALEGELPKISIAMGITLSRSDLKVRVRPRKIDNADGETASLGVYIDHRMTEGWRQYYIVFWEKDVLGASSSVLFKDTTLALKVSNAMKKAEPKPEYSLDLTDENELYLMRLVTPDEMEQLPEILRELFREWTRLWQRIGGLNSCKK